MTSRLLPTQFQDPIYKDTEHALTRAFGDVRPTYGKCELWVTIGGRSVLSPQEQLEQDAMVKQMCREHLSHREYSLLLTKYGHAQAYSDAVETALNDMACYITAWCDTEPLHAKHCIVRWTGRHDLITALKAKDWPWTLNDWAAFTKMKKSTLGNRRWEIFNALDALYVQTFDEVKSLLQARWLI